MTAAGRAALRASVADEGEARTRFLADLVRIPSDNPPGDCAPVAERHAGLLERLGFAVERHPVPAETVRAHGMMSATNLVIRRRFGPGPTVALNAHGDVVPPGEGWSEDPYGAAVRDGWMYGRGAAVSKSDFATYAFALRALEAAPPAGGTVELHFTYDEETGGEIGPRWLLERGLSKPDYAICAGFSYSVVTAHNGCLHLEVVVEGRTAHAAIPATGVDALECASLILAALYARRRRLGERQSGVPGIGAPQLTVGLIQGGVNTNVVPGRVVLRLDRRIIPEENPAAVEAELRDIILEAARPMPDAVVSLRRILLAAPLRPLPGAERLARHLASQASAVFGTPIGTAGVPLYTDARHYAAAGIPTVLYGAGPRSIEAANAHRADERLPLADLHRATEVVALALDALLGEAGE